jgi:hypothetical protein
MEKTAMDRKEADGGVWDNPRDEKEATCEREDVYRDAREDEEGMLLSVG